MNLFYGRYKRMRRGQSCVYYYRPSVGATNRLKQPTTIRGPVLVMDEQDDLVSLVKQKLLDQRCFAIKER